MHRQGRKHSLHVFAGLMLPIGAACAGPSPAFLSIQSASFTDGGSMPAKLSCDGANLSPDIRLPRPPDGTRSFAIVVMDPDAPVAFAHWLAYDIPAETRDLPEGASTSSHRLEHAVEGINGFGHAGYGGPCPPSGTTHHYVFHVYALDSMPALPSGADALQVNTAIQGHVLAEGRITGLYTRS
ncbi:YbhB/YbcL family Raf kinase inhibitor-like protein [Dyella sp.]|jgi:Raf kinase inhibitor-like YbhB/YbcL family protein|uniref:YbhB/YbcL family Raf kinase inhibitor-like protein n=1 Tax=Dyella sp. TaxID=1869338 RepID=UPI002FD90181